VDVRSSHLEKKYVVSLFMIDRFLTVRRSADVPFRIMMDYGMAPDQINNNVMSNLSFKTVLRHGYVCRSVITVYDDSDAASVAHADAIVRAIEDAQPISPTGPGTGKVVSVVIDMRASKNAAYIVYADRGLQDLHGRLLSDVTIARRTPEL
jgi:hypothetical protein